MQGVEITQLLCNLREKDLRISPTVHAMVLLMPTQNRKYLRAVIDLAGVDEASGPYFTWLAQFSRMFMDNWMFESKKLEEALQVYESFHVLEALPSRWNAQHLFKCNCSTCFQYASCPMFCSQVWCGMLRLKFPYSVSQPHFSIVKCVVADPRMPGMWTEKRQILNRTIAQIHMPMSPSSVSGFSAGHFWSCRSLDEL